MAPAWWYRRGHGGSCSTQALLHVLPCWCSAVLGPRKCRSVFQPHQLASWADDTPRLKFMQLQPSTYPFTCISSNGMCYKETQFRTCGRSSRHQHRVPRAPDYAQGPISIAAVTLSSIILIKKDALQPASTIVASEPRPLGRSDSRRPWG